MVRAHKKWGQHWLASSELADSLVRAMGPRRGDTFLEIGAGRGALTEALLRHKVDVVAVEIDPQCAERLAQLGHGSRLRVIRADVLEAEDQIPWGATRLRLAGNLPYNVSSPILRWTARHRADLVDAHYMLQEEVAERLTSAPGSRAYGLLSVLMQWEFSVQIVKRLSPGAFRPPPRVRSAFVKLQPRQPVGGSAPDEHQLAVLTAAFRHRRKQLATALRLAGWDRPQVEEGLAACGVESSSRAENLRPEDFACLAARLSPRSR